MRIAVCDDEKTFRVELHDYLNKYYKSLDIIIDSFSSGEKLLEQFKMNAKAYDLVFLDIEMEKIDGISTAKLLRRLNRDVFIIFLTSHLEFALDGYEVDAFRFLTKPVNEKKLIHALQDVHNLMDKSKKLFIKDSDKEILLYDKDIVFLEAQNVNVRIRTKKEEYIIRKTLMEMEKNLDGVIFYKPHRSYLINLECVADYSNKTITMETGESIPLSRNKYAKFKDALMMYVKICGR